MGHNINIQIVLLDANYQKKVRDAVKEDIALDGIGVVPVTYIKKQHKKNIQIVILKEKGARCGARYGGRSCGKGRYCSRWNWCGTSHLHKSTARPKYSNCTTFRCQLPEKGA